MGRTNTTFRDVLRALEDRWQPFRRALRYEDQERFDQLLTYVRNHADAAGSLNHQSPVIPVLVVIALAQERRLDKLEARVEEITATADDISTGLDPR